MTLNNIVIHNRGDSLELKFPAYSLGAYASYTLEGLDTIYFGLMLPGQKFEDAILRKKLTIKDDLSSLDDLTFIFKPEDTLDLLPGKYFYSVKLWMKHPEIDSQTNLPTGKMIDKVITLINKTKFIIL
jgi:hypothetical protein